MFHNNVATQSASKSSSKKIYGLNLYSLNATPVQSNTKANFMARMKNDTSKLHKIKTITTINDKNINDDQSTDSTLTYCSLEFTKIPAVPVLERVRTSSALFVTSNVRTNIHAEDENKKSDGHLVGDVDVVPGSPITITAIVILAEVVEQPLDTKL